MKKMKCCFMLLAMLLMAASTKAEDMQYVVFDLTDGTQTVIALQDRPVITYQNGEMNVSVAGETKLTASLGDVVKYSFSDTPLSIEQLPGEQSRIEMGHVYVTHAPQGTSVRVFTADGRMVTTERVADNGTADIDLTTLGKGIYIVKSARSSIKIINK